MSPTCPYQESCWQGTLRLLVGHTQVAGVWSRPDSSEVYLFNVLSMGFTSKHRKGLTGPGKRVLFCFVLVEFSVCPHGRDEVQIHSTC